MYKTEAHNSSRVLMIKWHCFIQNAYMVVATTSATSAVVKSVMSQGHWCLSQEAALSTLRILILPCLSSRSKWETLPGSAASLGWILTHTPSNHNLKIKNGDSSAVLGLFKITLTMLRFLFYFVSWDRVSLCSSECPGIHCVDNAGRELTRSARLRPEFWK